MVMKFALDFKMGSTDKRRRDPVIIYAELYVTEDWTICEVMHIKS